MSKHTQSILVFGLILPFGVLLLILGTILYGRGQLETQKTVKQAAFEKYLQADAMVSDIERELGADGRRDRMQYWNEQLEKDFVQGLTRNLNEITSRYNEDQLKRTELSRPSGRSPMASATENEFSRFKLSFQGGFGPMQKTLAELELMMPQLVLESLKVQTAALPGGTSSGLKFDVVYLCWNDQMQTGPR